MSLGVFESDANVIWIKLSQMAGAHKKGLGSTKYNQTACLSPRCYQMLMQCCKYVTRRITEEGMGGGNLLLVFLKVFVSFWLSFWNDFSLVKNYLSSISVSFDYVLWDFFCFPHHFSYTVYLKDQLSLVWQLMLCVCLSNNRVVCIKAV